MRKLLLITILFLGLAESGYGLWIPAKAWLSQQLIDSAWNASRQSQQRVKPWSWADTWPVLQLSWKDEQLIVLNGTSGQAMAFAPGFMTQSQPPGKAGNTILSAHRDTHFEFLKEVKIGELVNLQDIQGRNHQYRISQTNVVDSRYYRLRVEADTDILTLVTCYPFEQISAGGTQRFIVTATRV